MRGDGNNIYIYEDVKIGQSVYIKIDNCSLTISSDCMFNGANIEFLLGELGTKIEVGEGCLFANNISLKTTDNHPIYDKSKKHINIPGDIYIGNRVWVCNDVLILNNSIIPDGSVVATRTLVNKEFKDAN